MSPCAAVIMQPPRLFYRTWHFCICTSIPVEFFLIPCHSSRRKTIDLEENVDSVIITDMKWGLVNAWMCFWRGSRFLMLTEKLSPLSYFIEAERSTLFPVRFKMMKRLLR